MTSCRTTRAAAATIALCAVALSAPSVVRAADLAPDAKARGAAVFSTYCALCHGGSGKGDGRAAHLQKAPPSDLTASTRSRHYRLQIVRRGGAAMRRSTSMPAWGEVLSEQEIADVVAYLEKLGPAGNRGARAQTDSGVDSYAAPGAQQ